MSLEEKWEEYRIAQEYKFTDGGPIEKILEQALQRAFYAGAEAVLDLEEETTLTTIPFLVEIQAEIDHFRSHK